MATFKFRVRELWIYMQMKFKLYSRARIDLLELKSRIIHVLKNVEYNRG